MGIRTKLVIFCLSVAHLAGCSHMGRTVSDDHKPDPYSSYIYGNFYLINEKSTKSNKYIYGGKVKSVLAISLKRKNTEDEPIEKTIDERYLVFGKKDINRAHMIRVQPGEYNMNKLIIFRKKNNKYIKYSSSKLFRTSKKVIVKLDANKIYYIGDYLGYSDIECHGGCEMKWKLMAIKDSMNKSTENIKTQYKHFRSIPSISLLPNIFSQLDNKHIYNKI